VIKTSVPVKNAPYVPNPVSSIPPFNQVPVTGVDANGTYLATLQLGAAGSAAAMLRQADIGLGGLGPQPVQPVHQPSRHVTRATGGIPSGGGGSAPAPPAAGASAPAAGSPPKVAASPRASGLLSGFGLDLSRLYLVLALGSGALFLGWRLRAAAQGRTLPFRRRTT
jgi:hypothetical protein